MFSFSKDFCIHFNFFFRKRQTLKIENKKEKRKTREKSTTFYLVYFQKHKLKLEINLNNLFELAANKINE